MVRVRHSAPLHLCKHYLPVWWNGRHAWLRTKWFIRAGSSPVAGTTKNTKTKEKKIMRFNNGEHIEYFVNEEKRTVVAVLYANPGVMGNEMLRIMRKESGNNFGIDDCMLGKAMILKGRYEGKAVCHIDDEWDVEQGMHIAKLRALRLYMRDRLRIAERLSDIFSNLALRFVDSEEYTDYSINHIEEAIAEYVNPAISCVEDAVSEAEE